MTINVSDRLIYLAVGCGIGAVLGVLFAPRSGKEIRHNLTNRVDGISHKVQDKVQHARVGETATQTWHNVVEMGKNAAGITRRRMNESVETDDWTSER